MFPRPRFSTDPGKRPYAAVCAFVCSRGSTSEHQTQLGLRPKHFARRLRRSFSSPGRRERGTASAFSANAFCGPSPRQQSDRQFPAATTAPSRGLAWEPLQVSNITLRRQRWLLTAASNADGRQRRSTSCADAMPVVRRDTSPSDVGRVVPFTSSPHARSVGHLDAPASQYTHSQTSRKSAHLKSLCSDEARSVGSALGLQIALPHLYDVWKGCKRPGPRVSNRECTTCAIVARAVSPYR